MKQDLILERVEFGKENNKHFFILSVFDPKACRYLTTALQCYLMNEQEKKRVYSEKIFQIKHGTSVYSICGSMGRACQTFYLRLSDLLSEKRDLPSSIWCTNWIRIKICFTLHMFQLYGLELEAPVLRGELPPSRSFLKSPVVRWSWLKFLKSITLFTNSMWKFWQLITKLRACVAFVHHLHHQLLIRINKST